MIYKRLFENDIDQWYKNDSKTPLVVLGARQVGKTTSIINWIMQNNLNYIYVNFLDNKELIEPIVKSPSYESIINFLSLNDNKDKTKVQIVFLDEIQVNEELLYLTRIFKDKPIKLICSGSLLGLKFAKKTSRIDVGSKNYLKVYPLNFKEFLIWTNNENYLNEIEQKFKTFEQIHPVIHKKILDLYYQYLLVGGMPEVVTKYIDNNLTFNESVENVKKRILIDYINDNKNSLYQEDNIRISSINIMNIIYDTIDTFLIQPKNKRFIIDSINKNYRYKNVMIPIELLKASNIVNICNNVDVIKYPLHQHKKETFFKLYYSDIGLLTQKLNLNESMLFHWQNNKVNSDIWGGVIENSVICNLQLEEYYYYASSKNGNNYEIDLLIQLKDDGSIVPIEIKSTTGKFTKAKSIEIYSKDYKPSKIFLIGPNNFNKQENKFYIPIYASYLIRNIIK